jgi:hypothetical protein
MVSAIDSARLSTVQIHLHAIRVRVVGVRYRFSTAQNHLLAITAREDGVSYRFSSTLYSTDSLTSYNSQRRWCQLSAIDSARLDAAQIHLQSITGRKDDVSYRFSSTLYSTDLRTSYNSQRRWC